MMNISKREGEIDLGNRVSLPIKEISDLRNFKEAVRMNPTTGNRNLVLVEIGLSTGLRIGDILELKKKDVFGGFVTVKTQKTNDYKRIQLNPRVWGMVQSYCEGLNDDDLLFSIKYGQALKMIKTAAAAVGLQGISSHSLRKTAAWHFYQRNKDIRLTQEFLGHESPTDTIKYLNLTQDEVNHRLVEMDLD